MMDLLKSFRSELVTLVVVAATIASFVGLTSWPLMITFLTSALVGLFAVLLDLLTFRRKSFASHTTWSVLVALIAAFSAVAGLGLAFQVGYTAGHKKGKEALAKKVSFPMIVVSASIPAKNGQPATEGVYSIPSTRYQPTGGAFVGTLMSVNCFVMEEGRRWFKVNDGFGWMKADALQTPPPSVARAGEPPKCV